MEAESYYVHGPLAALAFVALSYLNLRTRQPLSGKKPVLAVCTLIAISVITFYCQVQRIHFGEYLGLALIFATAFTLIWGFESLKDLRWAFWFLFLAIPVPSFTLVHLTFYLRELAVVLVVAAMKLTPLTIIQEGNLIQYGSHWIRVADECSGLRTLISVIAMCSALAYFEKSFRKRVIYFALAIPAAVLGNTFRILLMAVGIATGYEKQTLGSWHGPIGWFALAVVIAVIFLLVGAIPEEKDVTVAVEKEPVDFKKLAPKWVFFFLTALFIAVTGLRTVLTKADPDANLVRHQAGEKSQIAGWSGEDLGQPEIVYQILGTKDLRYRVFTRQGFDGELFYFEMNSPLNQSGTHPPEISLISEGYEVAKTETVKFKKADGEWNAKRIFLKGPKNDLLVYYWFGVNDYRTDQYLGHQIKSFLQLITGHTIRSTTRKVSIELPKDQGDLTKADAEIRSFIEQSADR